MVVGAGIAGIQAALDLAEGGHRVHLLERKPAVGGTMPMLARTFPNNECSICSISPKLAECARHPNIIIYNGARLTALDGEPGAFRAMVAVEPRGVDVDRCKACGDCAEVCPVTVPDEFNRGLAQRRAVFQLYPQGFPKAYAIDSAACLECGVCAAVCPAEAITLSGTPEVREIEAGAVILAPGFKPYDPTELKNYGYGRLSNVVTSLELERMLSANGPTGGRLLCPSDGRPPRRVAWIQCIGSRNERFGRRYCSSICCMTAVKGALAAKEQAQDDLLATVFYMDLRTHGKGYHRYYERAVKDGVRFIPAGIHEVVENADGKLVLRYVTPSGEVKAEVFDLVVLSVGMDLDDEAAELAQTVGVELDEDGVCVRSGTGRVETQRPGIFVAGAFGGPCDIATAVTEGSAAAGEAARYLAGQRDEWSAKPDEVPELETGGEEPRVGVIVCRCGTNIAQTVRVADVVEACRRLPGVVMAEDVIHACAPDGLEKLRQKVAEHGVNRVVVAACSPRSHKFVFQNAIREVGLNRSLCEMANIRDHCAWVHRSDPTKATAKAERLVRMAVAKAKMLESVDEIDVAVRPVGLVVGGGASGMSAALSLADQGFEVHLVEKEELLGGLRRHRNDDEDRLLVDQLIRQCTEHALITVHAGQTVEQVRGHVGDFRSRLSSGIEIRHGVAVLATGMQESTPEGYGYGIEPGVYTLGDLESGRVPLEKQGTSEAVVFIQCVGSRNEKRPYCSRTCCTRSMVQALKLKEKYPEVPVYVIYRDLTTYGVNERYYRRAREVGVVFIRYTPEHPPRVDRKPDGLNVLVQDPILQEMLAIRASAVILAAAAEPGPDTAGLARVFKVPTDRDGFFLEAHTALRPVEFSAQGMYACGSCVGPKSIGESMIQGRAVGGRAGSVLAKGSVRARGVYACVDREKCAACLNCVRVCPFNVPRIEGNASVIEPIQCQGCGICVAGCPNQAIHLLGYSKEQLTALIKAMFK